MKKLWSLSFVLCFVTSVWAQTAQYSYFDDRKFLEPDDLLGYTFRPAEIEKTDGKNTVGNSRKIGPNDISFGVSRDYLYVKMNSEEAKYSVNSINSEQYGYKMDLMDARNPSIQGHLKFILDEEKYVRALVFKKSKDEKETIYHQAEQHKKISDQDVKFFTDKDEQPVAAKGSDLWGKSINPFFLINGSHQSRIYAADSTRIWFTQDTVIVKKAKEKVEKTPKKGKEKEATVAENSVEDTEATTNPQEEETTADEKNSTKKPKDKIKIVEKVHVRYMDRGDDGKEAQLLDMEFLVKSIKEMKSPNNGPGDDDMRYLLEMTVEGLRGTKTVNLYLTDKRTISAFNVAEFTFLMRGL